MCPLRVKHLPLTVQVYYINTGLFTETIQMTNVHTCLTQIPVLTMHCHTKSWLRKVTSHTCLWKWPWCTLITHNRNRLDFRIAPCNYFCPHWVSLTRPWTHHSMETDSEVHIVIMKKGISILVLSYREGLKTKMVRLMENVVGGICWRTVGSHTSAMQVRIIRHSLALLSRCSSLKTITDKRTKHKQPTTWWQL